MTTPDPIDPAAGRPARARGAGLRPSAHPTPPRASHRRRRPRRPRRRRRPAVEPVRPRARRPVLPHRGPTAYGPTPSRPARDAARRPPASCSGSSSSSSARSSWSAGSPTHARRLRVAAVADRPGRRDGHRVVRDPAARRPGARDPGRDAGHGRHRPVGPVGLQPVRDLGLRLGAGRARPAPGLGMLFYGLARGDGELARDGLRTTADRARAVLRVRAVLRGRDRPVGPASSRTCARTCRTWPSASAWCSSCCRCSLDAAQRASSRKARLGEYGRNSFSTRVIAEVWTVSAAARGPGREPGDLLHVGPSLTVLALHRACLPQLPSALLAAADHRARGQRGSSPRGSSWRWGPDRLGPLLGLSPSTICAVLRRSGLPRLADIDRPIGLPVRRYEVCHPGALVHQEL